MKHSCYNTMLEQNQTLNRFCQGGTEGSKTGGATIVETRLITTRVAELRGSHVRRACTQRSDMLRDICMYRGTTTEFLNDFLDTRGINRIVARTKRLQYLVYIIVTNLNLKFNNCRIICMPLISKTSKSNSK